MRISQYRMILVLSASLLFVVLASPVGMRQILAAQAHAIPGCENPGWFPSDFGLKDHYIFWHEGYYYLISTYVPTGNPNPLAQDRFVYARSVDFCSWEQLSPVLMERLPGAWDEAAVWAPHVYVEGGVYYLYYTGVTNTWTQTILAATTENPSEPQSWQKQDMLFQPNHANAVWFDGAPSACRDPFLLKYQGTYYLFYTGLDVSGGVIGVATAASPLGPWTDQGSIIAPVYDNMLESPAVIPYGDLYYLFYNLARVGEYYHIGSSPTGPWLSPQPFTPGWTHEIWQSVDGAWFTSFLTDYSVTIAPLVWDHSPLFPRPMIDWTKMKIYLPLIKI